MAWKQKEYWSRRSSIEFVRNYRLLPGKVMIEAMCGFVVRREAATTHKGLKIIQCTVLLLWYQPS